LAVFAQLGWLPGQSLAQRIEQQQQPQCSARPRDKDANEAHVLRFAATAATQKLRCLGRTLSKAARRVSSHRPIVETPNYRTSMAHFSLDKSTSQSPFHPPKK
jgi:hypothetical protein